MVQRGRGRVTRLQPAAVTVPREARVSPVRVAGRLAWGSPKCRRPPWLVAVAADDFEDTADELAATIACCAAPRADFSRWQRRHRRCKL